MKKIGLILFFISFLSIVGCSIDFDSSSEEEAYYSNREFEPFVPKDNKEILGFNNPLLHFSDLKSYTPFISVYDSSPVQDSLMSQDEVVSHELGFPISWIIKQESKGNLEVILYTSNEYDDYVWGEQGYWIAIRRKNKWNKYYTGLSDNSPLHLKWNSSVSLIKNDSTLSIEAALLKKTSPGSHPIPGPEYELVKDGLVVDINLNILKLDSDLDGLTNIEEDKMMLNPYNSDSDSDGINDYLDLNPRYKSITNDTTLLFEYIVSSLMYSKPFGEAIIIEKQNKKVRNFSDTLDTYLMVSDNENLQRITPYDSRLIIMTTDEYKKHRQVYYNSFLDCSISPMFKVDWRWKTYKVTMSFFTGGETFLITKVKKGWKVKVIRSWIS